MNTRESFPTFHAASETIQAVKRRPPIVSFRRIAGYVLGGLCLLLLLALLVLNVVTGRALEAELAKVRQKGEPLTLKELAPPPIPDEENAALIYDQAFEKLRRAQDKKPPEQRQYRNAGQEDPILFSFTSDDPKKRGKVTLQQVRQSLQGAEETVSLTRKAAAMPIARFPVDWEAGAAALFPHHGRLRSLTRLLAAHAILSAREGKPDEALADLEAIAGIARHIGGEPILISNLMSGSFTALARRALNEVLRVSDPAESRSRRLAESLARIRPDESLTEAVKGERAFGVWVFNVVKQDPRQLIQLTSSPSEGGMGKGLSRAVGYLGSPLFKWDETIYLRLMEGQIRQAENPGTRTDPNAEEKMLPRYAMVSRLIFPALQATMNKRDESNANLALSQWGLALEAYRQKHGKYPAALKSVPSLTGTDLPNDPFTGKPLLYKPEGDGYLLYSVGTDRQDGGGSSELGASPADPYASRKQKDIVWRMTG